MRTMNITHIVWTGHGVVFKPQLDILRIVTVLSQCILSIVHNVWTDYRVIFIYIAIKAFCELWQC